MNLIPKPVRRWLVKAAVKASGLAFIPRWARYSFQKYAFSTLIDEAYKGNATVYACVRILNWSFSEPELWPYEMDDDEQMVKLPKRNFRVLMNAPNDDMGEAELMRFCITYCSIGGNVYLWKQRNRAGQVIALWPFHDGHMRPIPGITTDEGLVAYYILDVGDGNNNNPFGVRRNDNDPGSGVPIPKADIVHWKWMIDPSQPWRGIGALEAAAGDIDVANEVRSFVYSLLKNDATPPIVVNLAEGDDYDKDKADRLRQQWRERFGGVNRGAPAFLEYGMTVTQLGFNLQQLQMDSLRDGPDTAVCMGFGIQPSVVGTLVGLKTSGVQANFEEARKQLTEMTLIPLWRSFESEFQQSFAKEKGYEGVLLRFDRSQVAALQVNKNEVWMRTETAWNSGLITRADARSEMGLPVRTGDDVYKESLTTILTPAGDVQKRLGSGNGRGQQKLLPPGQRKEQDYSDSVMVAFFPKPEEARQIAMADGWPEGSEPTPPEEIHLTLLFLGDTDDIPVNGLVAAVANFADRYRPVSGRINGYGRFTNTNIEDTDAVYAVYDAQQLPAFRQALVDALAYAGIASPSEHGFVPHITLAYVPSTSPTPPLNLPLLEITFDSIVVAYGNNRMQFMLTGEKRLGERASVVGNGRIVGDGILWNGTDQYTRPNGGHAIPGKSVDWEQVARYLVKEYGTVLNVKEPNRPTSYASVGKDRPLTIKYGCGVFGHEHDTEKEAQACIDKRHDYAIRRDGKAAADPGKFFPYGYARRLKDDWPDIWDAGGNERGNETFELWTRYRDGERTEAIEYWIETERPAWGARHHDNFRLAGVVAQIKWGWVGALGVDGMKRVIEDGKERLDGKFLTAWRNHLGEEFERQFNGEGNGDPIGLISQEQLNEMKRVDEMMRSFDLKQFSQGDGGASDRQAPRDLMERQRASIVKMRDVRAALLKRSTGMIGDYFKAYGERAETAVLQFKGIPANHSAADLRIMQIKQAPLTDAELDQLLDLLLGLADDAALEQTIQALQLSVIEETWPLLDGLMGIESQFMRNDPAVTAVLQTAGQRVKDINEGTRQQLVAHLQFGNENGWSIEDLAYGVEGRPGIADFISETYNRRAETIARTELGTAQAEATAARYEANGFDKVVIFDNGFSNSHPVCVQLDGTIQTTAWYRDNELQHPGCVRAAAPYFEDML